MMKKESKWETVLNQYFREKKFYCFHELKVTVLDYFPFSKLEIHQYDGLQATEKEGLVWKWSDQDQRQKPCDGVSIPPLPSYLVIKFVDGFYFIRVGDIVKMREDGHMAITRDYAEQIAEKIIKVDSKNKNVKER